MNRYGFIPAVAFALSLIALPAGALEVGDKAPDFELQSSQAGKFKLSDYAGKKNVLVQFYVLDYTPT
jgi:thioredoxin-dependent peroxiredoxin